MSFIKFSLVSIKMVANPITRVAESNGQKSCLKFCDGDMCWQILPGRKLPLQVFYHAPANWKQDLPDKGLTHACVNPTAKSKNVSPVSWVGAPPSAVVERFSILKYCGVPVGWIEMTEDAVSSWWCTKRLLTKLNYRIRARGSLSPSIFRITENKSVFIRTHN